MKEEREHVSDETFAKMDDRRLVMGFILRCDARVHVLMITFGEVVTDNVFLAGFAAVKDFVSQRGPHHGITNFSQVENFGFSNELLNELRSMAPAFHDRNGRRFAAKFPNRRNTVPLRQQYIGDDNVRISVTEKPQSFVPVVRLDYYVSSTYESSKQRFAPWPTDRPFAPD
jgi:hypothetical protein